MESYKNNDYDSAVKYLSKAAKLNEGKKTQILSIHYMSAIKKRIIQISR